MVEIGDSDSLDNRIDMAATYSNDDAVVADAASADNEPVPERVAVGRTLSINATTKLLPRP